MDQGALKPEIVETDDDGDPARLCGLDHIRAQEQEVLDMKHVGSHFVEVAFELTPKLGIDHVERIVGTDRDTDPPPGPAAQRLRLAGAQPAACREDERFMPELFHPARHSLGLELGARLLVGRKPVNHVEDSH
jgi:hypothetical protein